MSLLSNFLASGQSAWTYLVTSLLLFIIHLVRNRYRSGFHKIPGPFIASLTDLWQFFHCLAGRSWRDYELHRKYNSPLLRLGPNLISVADPAAMRIIYGYKPTFKKSDFYISQVQENSRGEPYHNLASTQDETEHALLRRPVARTYALSTLIAYEPLVDSTFQMFKLQVTQRFVEQEKECPLDKWLQMYAFDVIGELVFSRRLGFLESGTDVDNMMHLTGKVMEYTGIMGHIPYVDNYLRIKNPLRRFIGEFPIIGFTLDRIREHQRQPENQVHPDFVTQFIKASEKYPEVMTEDRIAENARTAIGAGSDTTAIALREILFRLLVKESTFERFMQELKTQLAARPRDENFDNPISWAEGMKMTFFQALIKECLRYHSPLAQLLPRSVPEGGVTLCGQFIPEGTVVGCNAWTIHRNSDLYGEDADQFRPERWLEATPEQLQKMENMNFAFGGGPRICIGKNIAMLEITKFIPEFFRRFEVQLVDAARYTYHPGWLVPQTGLDVKLRLREPDQLVL